MEKYFNIFKHLYSGYWNFLRDEVLFNNGWDYGPLKYILNNPKINIWHHAKGLPKQARYGVNFGLSLSLWDYLFKTNYIPHNGKDIELSFEGDENFLMDFISQEMYPMSKK